MLIRSLGETGELCSALEPLPMRIDSYGTHYSERWLQLLIQRNPLLLSVEQIEPGLGPPVPVCIELPLTSGFADNLLLTKDGSIVVVEAKLWRNPEARRQVVGQVLDYAKDLSRLTYEGLQAAVRLARSEPALDLFRLVHGEEAAEEDETAFVDAVARNLSLGRFLLIIAGDGIQQQAEQLAEFLQRHIGLHFTLSLVEISLWRAPESGDVFVQPKVVTKTVQIERAVVRMEGQGSITPASIAPAAAAVRPTTLTEEQFYEALRAVDPALPGRLNDFLADAGPLGIFPDIKRRLSFKWRNPDGREFMLGGVLTNGRFVADVANGPVQAMGRVDLSHAYEAELARALPGASVRQTSTPTGWRVVVDGEDPPFSLLLDHKEAVLAAIRRYIASLGVATLASDA
jgi:hypothetical protein